MKRYVISTLAAAVVATTSAQVLAADDSDLQSRITKFGENVKAALPFDGSRIQSLRDRLEDTFKIDQDYVFGSRLKEKIQRFKNRFKGGDTVVSGTIKPGEYLELERSGEAYFDAQFSLDGILHHYTEYST